MGLIKYIKDKIKHIDNTREHVEDLIASGLRKIKDNPTVDKIEVVISNSVMTAVEVKFGISIPKDVRDKINNGVVSGCNEINDIVARQLER